MAERAQREISEKVKKAIEEHVAGKSLDEAARLAGLPLDRFDQTVSSPEGQAIAERARVALGLPTSTELRNKGRAERGLPATPDGI